MIGVLIVTHERFGFACEALSNHFFGCENKHVRHLMVQRSDDLDDLKIRAKKLRDSLDYGSGVLILNDIFGATPFNVARSLIDEKTVLLTGANASMIVRAVSYATKTDDLLGLLEDTRAAAIEGIINITMNNVNQYD